MISNFDDILTKSFQEFSDSTDDNVSILTKDQQKPLFGDLYDQVWKIETGLYDDENSVWLIEDLTIYIAFPSEFPLMPSVIFFDRNDFPKVGHIPHITTYDAVCDICVFDEFVILDKSKPTQIILEHYEKAKQTLIDGITGKNHNDFEDEFIAYWEAKSGKNDRFESGYYSIINKEPENSNDIQALIYNYNEDERTKDSILLFNKKEDNIKQYQDYLNNIYIKFEVIDVFYLGELDNFKKPPFSLTTGNSLQFIDKENIKEYKSFINIESKLKIHVFLRKIENKSYYIGWRFPKIKNFNKNGYRTGKLKHYDLLLNRMLPTHNNNVFRFRSNDLNLKRLIKRTSSDQIKTRKTKLLIAGVGSVGSNLITLLNSLNFPDFTLVDIDTLGAENIGRHLLGFKYLGEDKVDALKHFLKSKLPSQSVNIFKQKITDLYHSNIDVFHNQDYIFLCTGKQNIDKSFIEEIQNNRLGKPIFILWVEPYLLGGQCLYINPSSKTSVTDLFYDVYKYKHAIINQEELVNKRELFTLKESGCQSTYSPYSSSHLSLFISSVYPKIFEIIENNHQQNKAFSWVGDTKIAQNLDVMLNVESNLKYSIIENSI